MAYYDGYLLGSNQDFLNRVGFAAETEGLGFQWGIEHRMSIAAAPGFSDAYASALAGNVPNPGRDEAVISDSQILAAIQAEAAGDA